VSYFIYELVDPRTGQSHYVGKTNNPAKRLMAHVSSSSSDNACNAEKKAWIQELLAEGLQPKINILEEVKDARLVRNREKHWIRTYISRGIALMNVDDVEDPAPKVVKPKESQGPSPFMQQIAAIYYQPSEARKKLGLNKIEFRRFVEDNHIKAYTNPLTNRVTYRRVDIDKFTG